MESDPSMGVMASWRHVAKAAAEQLQLDITIATVEHRGLQSAQVRVEVLMENSRAVEVGMIYLCVLAAYADVFSL